MKPKVLIADDSAAVRKFYRLVLKDRYFPAEAEDGFPAGAEFCRRSFDRVISEVRLPGLMGLASAGGSGCSARRRG